MLRLALLLFLVLAVLLAIRVLRVVSAILSAARRRPSASAEAVEGEMVRDPVCGTWIDRRLALAARKADEWIPVCSETCRARLAQTLREHAGEHPDD